jgi:hypothetical protein
MSSNLGVYGNSQTELNWMRQNYQAADTKFRAIHPTFESEMGRFKHGIVKKEDPDSILQFQYYWYIPCHWNSECHLNQTESDIRTVLNELQGPKTLEVRLS